MSPTERKVRAACKLLNIRIEITDFEYYRWPIHLHPPPRTYFGGSSMAQNWAEALRVIQSLKRIGHGRR